MAIKLKPCPFCRGGAQVVFADPAESEHIDRPCFGVECKSCHVLIGTTIHGRTDFYDTVDAAVDAWNRRSPDEGTLTEVVSEMEMLLKCRLCPGDTACDDCSFESEYVERLRSLGLDIGEKRLLELADERKSVE